MKTISIKFKTLVALATLATAGVAFAADETSNRGQLSASDYKFACSAASGGATEVAMGQLAAQKATDDSLKQFGQKMVDDHSKAGKQLQDIASRKGATLPMQPTAMEQKHIDKLNNLSGPAFDHEYMSMMLTDHKKDVKKFKHASMNADDPDLKSFASSTEPVVAEHLRMLESMPKHTSTQ